MSNDRRARTNAWKRVAVYVALGILVATPAAAQPEPMPPTIAPVPVAPAPVAPVSVAVVLAPPPAPTAAELEAEKKRKKDASAVAATARASVPQVTGLRDGTLGIPSSGGTKGVQAGIDTDADAFAKLGGLSFGNGFAAEFVAERYQSDVPRVLLEGTPVLPTIVGADISALGFRLRLGPSRRQWDVVYSWTGNTCSPAVEEKTNDENKDKARDGATPAPAESRPCDADQEKRVALEMNALARRSSGWTLSAGARYLTRVSNEEGGSDSKGVAGEVSVQYDRTSASKNPDNNLGFGLFASLSGIQMQSAEDRVGDVRAIYPSVSSLRLTLGGELQLNYVTEGGAPLFPRVGFFGTVARNHWTNDFGGATTDVAISGRELQAAIYFGGHFFGGFQGTVSFGMLQSYGSSMDNRQWMVNFTPSVGAPISKGDDK